MLLFEHTLLESAQFDQCRNRFCTHLYSAVRPDAPRETSGEVRTTSGRTSQDDASWGVSEHPRGVLKQPWALNHLASGARQRLENQKENQAGHSPERTVEGQTAELMTSSFQAGLRRVCISHGGMKGPETKRRGS